MRIFVLGNYMNAHFIHVIHVDRLPMAGESLAARGGWDVSLKKGGCKPPLISATNY